MHTEMWGYYQSMGILNVNYSQCLKFIYNKLTIRDSRYSGKLLIKAFN